MKNITCEYCGDTVPLSKAADTRRDICIRCAWDGVDDAQLDTIDEQPARMRSNDTDALAYVGMI